MKSVACKRKHLPAKKSIFACKKMRLTAKKCVRLQKKRLPAVFFVPTILLTADVKAQRALI
jgi:hypothetical protein